MSFIRHSTTVYPEYAVAMNVIASTPLSTRSVLIKCCQGQIIPSRGESTVLSNLLLGLPDIVYFAKQSDQSPRVVSPIDFFHHVDASPSDVLESSIMLDLLRGVPTTIADGEKIKRKGWNTEIQLSEDVKRPNIDFFPLLFNLGRSIHPELPYNPQSALYVRNIFEGYRRRITNNPPTLFARATHKNMSRSTRRDYEEKIGGNLCILDVNIFGQDDWQRVYHDRGIMLEGEVEMRQKWYPSGAKPRTYFAMGGTCYRDSRFLQDFFTDLVNLFPSTNHITRLQPQLLQALTPDHSFLIYDMSSFTSNMRQQKNFCLALAEFFRGVYVTIVDEHSGPRSEDLGLLLDQYNETCVFGPHLSYERSPVSMGWSSIRDTRHGVASLLGIFGNLMSCTLAHFLILTPILMNPILEDETAGDDGTVMTHRSYHHTVLHCISFVGDFAEEKTYMSTESGAVCLKRPLWQEGTSLVHGKSIIPPTMSTVIAYLSGYNSDPRFEIYGLEDMSLRERVSTVGIDLLRFLREAYYTCPPDYQERLSQIFKGFDRLKHRIVNPTSHPDIAKVLKSAVWPLDPGEYDFFNGPEPFMVYARHNVVSFEMPITERLPVISHSLKYRGDVIVGNQDKRLTLLERLGYVEREERRSLVLGERAVMLWYIWFNQRKSLPPVVYEFRCVRDVPEYFLFD